MEHQQTPSCLCCICEQVQGKVRKQVAEAGKALGLDGTYIPFSYIEQVDSPPTCPRSCDSHPDRMAREHLRWRKARLRCLRDTARVVRTCRVCIPCSS